MTDFKRRGTRYKARRRAVDILFEAEARDIDPVALVEERATLSQDQNAGVAPIKPYTRDIVEGVAVELDRIDEVIERFLAAEWELDRLPAVDRAILRVSGWELLFNPDVPRRTAVVEGVELGSEYSTPVASPYINAVLDSVAKNLEDIKAEELQPVEDDADEDTLDEANETLEGPVPVTVDDEEAPLDGADIPAESDAAAVAEHEQEPEQELER
ncbi:MULTISPECIES: transcription antitermination factor NusB [Corynebacterium]|uniref:transcription antitermination factor NusB n=1 Tax=Corynebacterium TaxID=1716 RepID=UPI00124EC6CF|nr:MULTISPECIES: transcription antitermination factor NusB [Corynebacterium]